MLQRLLRVVALVAALLALVTALLGAYARHALVPARAFGERAASTLDAPAVRDALAREVAGRVASAAYLPPGIQDVVRQAVAAAAQRRDFRGVVRRGAAVLHRRLLAHPDRPVLLPLRGAEERVRAVLARRAPTLVAALPRVGDPVLRITGASALGHGLNAADRFAALLPAALVAAVALLGLAALLAPSARSAVCATGATILLAGVLVAAGTMAGRAAAVAAVAAGADRAVAGAVWDAFLGALRTWGIVLAVAGAVVIGLARLARGPAARQYATDAR